MKKRGICFLVGILILWFLIKLVTGYQRSLISGSFIVSGENIMLSYELVPTYLERIDTSECFELSGYEKSSYEDVLTIDYNALPYARGTIIIHIPKESNIVAEPMMKYVRWSNLDYDDISERLASEEELYMPYMATIFDNYSRCEASQIPKIQISYLYARGNTIEDCRVYIEKFMTDFAKIFTK